MNDPSADAVRGVLDGHIVLSRTLAERGLFPAVDVLRSVSRVIDDITTPEHRRAAARVRDLMSAHAEASDLIKIGAYVRGSDPRVDTAVAAAPRIEALMRPGLDEGATRDSAMRALAAVV